MSAGRKFSLDKRPLLVRLFSSKHANAYSGDNGRSAILNNINGAGIFFTVAMRKWAFNSTANQWTLAYASQSRTQDTGATANERGV